MSLIHDRLDDVAKELQQLTGTVGVLAEQVRAMRQDTVVPQLQEHARRLDAVEAWRWKLVGAAAGLSIVAPGMAGKLANLLGWHP